MQNKLLPEYWIEAKSIIQSRAKKGNPEYPTGISFLDDATDGLSKGEIWIIAGKAGSGKTSLGLQIAQSFAQDTKHTILFLSLEMKGWELVLRMFCSTHGLDFSAVKCGEDMESLNRFNGEFEEYINRIDFEIVEYGYSFDEVEKIIKAEYCVKKPDVIFLDFIQLIDWVKFGDERKAIMEYVRRLKELAKQADVGIVIISQLRRLPSGADYNRPPDIIDLKGSGSLEQTADKVIITYGAKGDEGQQYFINLAKNRQGITICKEVDFIGRYYTFKEKIGT